MLFESIMDKIDKYKGKRIEHRTALKQEINEFLNNPEYASYTGYKSSNKSSLGATKDPKK
jgi:Fe-S cluster biosynthesis and repair protein YggX